MVKKYKLDFTDNEVQKIKKFIEPTNDDECNNNFMYTIVCNKENGLDVDKYDYIIRDTYSIGLKFGFDYRLLFYHARVIDNKICYPEKIYYNLYELYATRYRLHKEIYNHPVTKSIEYMISDILLLLDNQLKISHSIGDSDKYCRFTDSILDTITFLDINNSNIKKANDIYNNINNRKLYKYIGEICSKKKIDVNIFNFIYKDLNITPNDIIIQNCSIGMLTNVDEHPMDRVWFYHNSDINKKFKHKIDSISKLVPSTYREYVFRLFLRDNTKEKQAIESFKRYKCISNDITKRYKNYK